MSAVRELAAPAETALTVTCVTLVEFSRFHVRYHVFGTDSTGAARAYVLTDADKPKVGDVITVERARLI